jgi:hypothetical protein
VAVLATLERLSAAALRGEDVGMVTAAAGVSPSQRNAPAQPPKNMASQMDAAQDNNTEAEPVRHKPFLQLVVMLGVSQNRGPSVQIPVTKLPCLARCVMHNFKPLFLNVFLAGGVIAGPGLFQRQHIQFGVNH